MAYRLTWSPSARSDLREISAYIAKEDPIAAGKFIRGTFQTVERLRCFPLSGRTVPEFFRPIIKEVIRRPCRIIYRVKAADSLVEIARVWHSARGIPEL